MGPRPRKKQEGLPENRPEPRPKTPTSQPTELKPEGRAVPSPVGRTDSTAPAGHVGTYSECAKRKAETDGTPTNENRQRRSKNREKGEKVYHVWA